MLGDKRQGAVKEPNWIPNFGFESFYWWCSCNQNIENECQLGIMSKFPDIVCVWESGAFSEQVCCAVCSGLDAKSHYTEILFWILSLQTRMLQTQQQQHIISRWLIEFQTAYQNANCSAHKFISKKYQFCYCFFH